MIQRRIYRIEESGREAVMKYEGRINDMLQAKYAAQVSVWSKERGVDSPPARPVVEPYSWDFSLGRMPELG